MLAGQGGVYTRMYVSHVLPTVDGIEDWSGWLQGQAAYNSVDETTHRIVKILQFQVVPVEQGFQVVILVEMRRE